MSQDSLPPPSYIVRIRCLLPLNSSEPTTLIVTPENKNPVMTSTTKTMASTSFGFASPSQSSSTTPQTTCNICKRLLYTFEEILRCRVCYGWYHWRCVKPDTVSHYGDHENYFCDKCTDGTTTKVNSSHRNTNGGLKDRSIDSIETDYSDLAGVPSKFNSGDTHIVDAIRYFEEKKQSPSSQTFETIKGSKLDSCLSPQTQTNEYHYRNGQHKEDSSRSTRQFPQQQQQQQHRNGIESDDGDHQTSATIQANYEYTPLKEYAAMRTTRISNDHFTNGYQNSPATNSERPTTSRYGGLHYSNHGYDPTVSRIVDTSFSSSNQFASPTIDNLSFHNRQQHFTSTTNLNIGDRASRRQQQQQQNSRVHSTPYLSQVRDDDFPVFTPLSKQQQQQQHQADSYPAGDNDSGIGINSNFGQHQPSDENRLAEKKLTDLVQQLGEQLENGTQKISEKLELKMKNLEDMIHQQTYIIRQQDEVIERLKGKITNIETERDRFRERLSLHEQPEQDGMTVIIRNQPNGLDNHDNVISQDHPYTRRCSDASTTNTESSKPSTKKTLAPRVDQQWSAIQSDQEPTTAVKLLINMPLDRERLESDTSTVPSTIHRFASSMPVTETPSVSTINNNHQPMVAKTVTKIPANRERLASDSSSAPSVASKLVAPGPSRRLDNMIHQTKSKDATSASSASYSLAEARRQDRPRMPEPVSKKQQQLITTVHRNDIDDQNHQANRFRDKRSKSSSSSSSTTSKTSSNSRSQPIKPSNVTPTDTTAVANRNSNIHRSFESLPQPNKTPKGLKPTDRATSLEFGTKPVQYSDPGSIYITPTEASQPAVQANSLVKGWLRKQNREAFFKRIERFYCVLTNNALLMHRHDHDRTPHKAINLKGAKVLYYDDPKHGPSLELTWANQFNDPKHYHLYAPNPQEAEQWVAGIQTTIDNLGNKNKWQQYRMYT